MHFKPARPAGTNTSCTRSVTPIWALTKSSKSRFVWMMDRVPVSVDTRRRSIEDQRGRARYCARFQFQNRF
ncbi:hypothetical protein L596_016481 [Steinernema carpocapsae]|uniref:Uncharacterized protein n=1 Tax=Steinernema carpocapsae TaxID=34508 RepID=A0A4U5NJ10_STECR|nr:hypothetical protein L596_016481 [Steinernema carpocapsae]